MVGMHTHKIVDMIPTREASEVAEWLKSFPNIKNVSRGGSLSYAAAITEAHPIVQLCCL